MIALAYADALSRLAATRYFKGTGHHRDLCRTLHSRTAAPCTLHLSAQPASPAKVSSGRSLRSSHRHPAAALRVPACARPRCSPAHAGMRPQPPTHRPPEHSPSRSLSDPRMQPHSADGKGALADSVELHPIHGMVHSAAVRKWNVAGADPQCLDRKAAQLGAAGVEQLSGTNAGGHAQRA